MLISSKHRFLPQIQATIFRMRLRKSQKNLANSAKLLKEPFGRFPMINTFRLFKNDVTHTFRLSIFSAEFEGWEQKLNILNPQPEFYFQPSQASAAMQLFLRKQLTADTAIIRSSRLVVFCKKGVFTNFAKFTRKHVHQGLVFNEAADTQSLTLSEKEILTKMFSCEFCKISHFTIFKEPKELSISAKKTLLQMFDWVLNTPL